MLGFSTFFDLCRDDTSRMRVSALIGLVLCILVACSSSVPSAPLTKDKMAEVLYDYHLAQAMAATKYVNQDSISLYQGRYTKAVLRKHGITQNALDSALRWYTRNADEMYAVYTIINERYEQTMERAGQHNQSVATVGEGTTRQNLWQGKEGYILIPYIGRNYCSFRLNTDSLLQPKAKLLWHFDTHFIFHSGTRSAVALLRIDYANDSVATQVLRIYDSGRQELQLQLGTTPVRSVYGQIYLDAPYSTNFKMLQVQNITLTQQLQPAQTNTTPSTTSDDTVALHSTTGDTTTRRTLQTAVDTMRAETDW